MNPLVYFSLISYVETCLLHLGIWCTVALMLDGNSLILLDVMKVDFTTYFILSRQSFSQAYHLCVCI